MSRRRHVVGEILRFMAVGGITTVVATVLYNLGAYGPFGLTTPLKGHIYWSYVVAHGIGMLLSYELSRRWTFQQHGRQSAGEGFVSYAIINVATLVTIPVGCLWFSHHAMGLRSPLADNISGNIVGLLLSQVARFFLFKRFVFHRNIRYTEVYGTVEDTGEISVPTDPSNGSPSGSGARAAAEG